MNERRALRLHDVMSFLPLCKSFFGEKNQTAEKEADGGEASMLFSTFPTRRPNVAKDALKNKTKRAAS